MTKSTNPLFAVSGPDILVGDPLVLGGPGASLDFEGSPLADPAYGWREGDEVRVVDVWYAGIFGSALVKVAGSQAFWDIRRFSLPSKPVDQPAAPVTAPGKIREIAERTVERWKSADRVPSKVVVIDDDIDVFAIPRRGFDWNKGDRRFTDPVDAIAYAMAEQERTGVQQVIRRDPGSPHFAELTLVQAMGS